MSEPIYDSPENLFDAPPSKPIDLFPLLMELVRGKWIILLCALVCAVAGFLYTIRSPITYQAEAKIIPPSSGRGVSGAAMLNQLGSGGDVGGLAGAATPLQLKPQSDVFVQVMKAWPIQQAIVKQFDLKKLYHANTDEQAMLILNNRVTLTTTKEDFIIVNVVDTDSKRSADMANAYIERTRDFLRSLSYNEASQRHSFYEGQLSKASEDLAEAELNFKKVQQSSGMISLDEQSRTLLETAATLRAQVTAKEVQLESLRSYSTESNSSVQIAESELNALRGQLGALESKGQGGKGFGAVSEAEIPYLHAARDLKYQEGLYDQLTKQFEGSRIDEARDAPIIQIIEPARIPSNKFGPRRGRAVRTAFGFGLAIGLVFILLRHWIRTWSPETSARLRDLRHTAFSLRS